MADLNKLRFGSSIPKNIMFDKSSFKYRVDFHKWVFHEGADIDISENGSTLTIKKFPANTWFIKSNESDNSGAHIAEMIKQFKVEITGLAALNKTIFNTPHPLNDNYKAWGLSLTPISNRNGDYYYFWWDLGIPNGYLKNPNRASNHFGFTVDGLQNIFNLNSFATNQWGPAVYQAGLYLYSGNYGVGEIIDISNTPIVIKQSVDVIKPYNIECWDMYLGSNKIYHRDKTIENCLRKYKYIHDDFIPSNDEPLPSMDGQLLNTKIGKRDVFVIDCNKQTNWYLPDTIDLEKYLINTKKFILWRCNIPNTEYYDKIRELYKKPITSDVLQTVFCDSRPFTGSNFGGKLTLNIDNSNQTYVFLFCRDLLYYSIITDLEINFTNCTLGSAQNLCRFATQLKTIKSNITFMTKDCSGLFEGCRSLKTYPSNLLDWSQRANYEELGISTNNICYAFEFSALTEIPSFNSSDRFANNNTIICHSFSAQAFNAMGSLIKIGPIIDCIYIDSLISGSAWRMFSCPSLVDVRIKNLNHGDWRFDDTDDGKPNTQTNCGNLPNLNKESIDYLFNNLYDLNKHDPNLQDTDYSNPHRNKANIYCPSQWEKHITSGLLNSAKTKNWNVYIGGILKN